MFQGSREEGKETREAYWAVITAPLSERRCRISPILRRGRLTGISVESYNPNKPGDESGRSSTAQSGD